MLAGMGLALLSVSALLAACAQEAPVYVPLRTNGETILGKPAEVHAFELANMICNGETQKAVLSAGQIQGGLAIQIPAAIERQRREGLVRQGCLAEKGYVLVPPNLADAMSMHFKKIASGQPTQMPTVANPVATASVPAPLPR